MNNFQTPTEINTEVQSVIKQLETNQLEKEYNSTIAVQNPATEETLIEIPDFEVSHAVAAIGTIEQSGKLWAQTTPRHRSDILYAAYQNLIAHKHELALLITAEMGKPYTESLGEVEYASNYVRWYAEEAVRSQGNYRQDPLGSSTILTTRVPVGPSLLITPWNFPMAMATRKISPALAAGCSVMVKPAALTPLTTLYVVQLMVEAGVPKDLIQVVTTSSSGKFSSEVMADPRIRKVSFTGSTPVGATLMAQAAKTIMKSSMELGGNAPVIIYDDADLERAVAGTIVAKLRNGGQSCVAANRILVQDGIAAEFVSEYTKQLSEVVIGNGFVDGVKLGPVIDQKSLDNHLKLISDAIGKGAELTTGGNRVGDRGFFLAATVLDKVPESSLIANEEIFGPISAISRFSTEDEAIEKANNTPFGLAGYVFSENIDRAFNTADRLEAGMIGINQGVVSNVAAPFGGFKQSGIGREGSFEGLEEYQEIKFFNLNRK